MLLIPKFCTWLVTRLSLRVSKAEIRNGSWYPLKNKELKIRGTAGGRGRLGKIKQIKIR